MILLVSVSFAKTDLEIEEAIQDVISQRHPTDTPAWWLGLGTSAPGVIISMYEKTTQTYTKVRLVEGLAFFKDNSRALEFLKQQAEKTDEDVIRHSVIRNIGFTHGMAEIDFLSKYLHHADSQTRLVAAQAIQKTANSKAQDIIEQYKKEEKARWIVDRLDGKLQTPLKPLTLVSSSEDNVSPIFLGFWKGYFVYPKRESRNLELIQANLQISGQTKTDVKGELTLFFNGKKYKTYILKDMKLRNKKLIAFLPKKISAEIKPIKQKEGLSEITGEIQEFEDIILFYLSAKDFAGSLVLRKE
ncbi:MAG: HEAT repeat domain-containing protein [Deltaproteobacteria bacterium]|nr:HEAT repeat domain-containing protein [Deltaproteobacteria bacterium]